MGDEVTAYQVVDGAEVPAVEPQDLPQDVRYYVQDETTASVVTLDADQWAWFQGSVRMLCSECLVISLFLGIACGLTAWSILSDSWR